MTSSPQVQGVSDRAQSLTASEDVPVDGYVILDTNHGLAGCRLFRLTAQTRFVHLTGLPYIWAIREILERAQNVKTIRVIPSAYGHLNPASHLRLCAERGVKVIMGYDRPRGVWKTHEVRDPRYLRQRKEFLMLEPEKRARFEELCGFGLLAARITSRYFCLKGEAYVSQRELCREFGLMARNCAPNLISAHIQAVRKYLDPSLKISLRAGEHHRSLVNKVARLRRERARVTATKTLLEATGLRELPDGLPVAQRGIFVAVFTGLRTPQMRALAAGQARLHALVLERYGLETWISHARIGPFRKLQELGDQHGGLSRERIRQLLEEAYQFLGIKPD